MAIKAELFDGTQLEFPDGTDPSVIQSTAKRLTLERQQAQAPQQKPEEVGFLDRLGAATKRGFEGFGDIGSGLGLAGTSVFGTKEETAKKMADIKKEQEAQAKGTPTLTASDIQRIAEERGLVSAGAKVPSYIAEQILQSAPQMALPLAVGAAASPFITPVGGAIAGIATYGIQQFGNFLVRQAQEKKNPEELEVAKAALTAAGTAPIGYFADKFTVGLGNIGSKKAISEIYAELGKRGVMKEVGKRAGVGAAEGVIAEAPTEVLEQAAELWQAGLPLDDARAMNEYKEAFFGAAAVGGGLGGGAKGLKAYGEYSGAKKAEAELAGIRSEKSALSEAEEPTGLAGIDTGANQPGVPGAKGEAGPTAGTEETIPGDMGGVGIPPALTRAGEETSNNQLATLRKQQAEIAAFDPTDPRIGEIEETIKEIQTDVRAFNAPGAAPTFSNQIKQLADKLYKDNYLDRQSSVEFKASRELKTKLIPAIEFKEKQIAELESDLIPNAISPEQKAKRERVLETFKKELVQLQSDATGLINSLNQQKPQAFSAPGIQQGLDLQPATDETQRVLEEKPSEFALAQETGALPTGEVTKVEEKAAEPTAKLMLVGEGVNPTAPAENFLNSIKPASQNPEQQVQFKNEVKNLIEDMLEFIGQTRKRVARYAEEGAQAPVPPTGPDVSVPLTGPQRQMRLNLLDKFFDSLSAAPAGQENLTATLAQRLPGMSLAAQNQAFQNLLNIPGINTVRGIKDVRAKLEEAIAGFEGEQIKEPVEKAAVYKNEETQSNPVRRAINILKAIPEKLRTPEEKAALAYFGRWNFGLAMRSAAFDLGSKANPLFTGPIFKGQNKTQAELFQKWVEENLPADEFRRFQATVDDFKKQTEKAEAYQKKAEEIEKLGSAATKVAQAAGRAPTGKAPAGKVKPREMPKPSPVSQLDASKFYPMHPAMQQAIQEGNLNGALSVLEHSGNKFHSALAKRLRSLGLQTAIVFDQQGRLATDLFNNKYVNQLAEVSSFVKATNPELYAQYFKEPIDFNLLQQALEKIDDRALIGQVEELKEGVKAAIAMLESSGTYVYGMDVVNLNREMGGASNYAFIHELVHAATVYSLDEVNYDTLDSKQKAAVNELKHIYDVAKKTGLNEYGFTNLHEFVAEAFSNKKFQELLQSIPYRGGQAHFEVAGKVPTKNSLWDKFTQLVAKLFKMDNMLGYTMANANILFKAPPPLTTAVNAFNAPRPKGSILAGTKVVGPDPMSFTEKMFGGRPSWEMLKSGVPGFLEDINDSLRKYYLGAFTLRQLNDMVGHRIPYFKEFINTTEKMLDDRNKILEQTKAIVDTWMNFQQKNPEKAKTMNMLMLDATLLGKDPAKGLTGNNKLDDAWKAIGPDGQRIYTEVRDFYRQRLNDYIQTNLDNKKAALMGRGFTEQEAANHPDMQKIRDFFAKHNIEPYFPIRRFGRYSLQIGSGTDKEFYLFESPRERRAFRDKRLAELKAEGKSIVEPDVIEKNSISQLSEATKNMKEFAFFNELRDLIQSTEGDTPGKLKDNLNESLEQLYFLTLPDQSVRKMFMNRKGTAGMNTDMLRAFTSSAFHMAYQHSRYKHSRDLYGSISGAEASLANRTGRQATIDREYVGELEQRLQYIMNPTDTGTIPSVLSNVSFLWYMTAPASAIVNMLGVPAVGLPVVAAKFGWGATSSRMTQFAKKFAGAGFKDKNGNWDFPTLDRADLTDVQRRAYEQLVADGVIDITLSHDLVGMTEAPSNLYTGRSNRVMKYLSGAFHGAEKFNREVVSMATFDLAYERAKKAGYTEEAAYKKAVNEAKDLTYKSMFDYSTLNKPRYFQNEFAKVILQFKQFSQQMTYLLARSVYEATYRKYSDAELQDIRLEIIGDHKVNKPDLPPLTDSEVEAKVKEYIDSMRTEARNRLAGTLGMTAMFAGVTGLPLWSVISMIMNAMQAVFGDDDDTFDFDNWFKNWCANTFGGFVGDSISRGVVSQTLGADIGSRIGLNDLWFRDARKSTDEVSAVQNMMINLLGPTAGLMINSAEALKQFNDGHIERAMETASPALIKNIMKGIRYGAEGKAESLKGNELVGDVSGYEAMMQGIGFNPERIAQRQKSNIEEKTAEQKILNRRNSIKDAFFLAVDNDDDALMDRVMEKVEKFNDAYPELALTGKDLQKSIRTRYMSRALAEETGGISINKKLVGRLSHMGEYGNPED